MAFPGGSDTARRQRVALVLLWLLLLAGWSLPAEASPLTKPEVLKLVRKSVQETRLLAVVRELGIDFRVTLEVADELRVAGASASLIAALRGLASPNESVAPVAPPPPTPPSSPPEPAPLQPVAAPPVAPSPPAASPLPPVAPLVPAPPVQPPPAPPPVTVAMSPPPPSGGSGPKGPAQVADDPPPRDEGPPLALEPLPPASLPRGALETMVALIPGPPPPPPPPVLGATAGLAESPGPPRPSEPPAPAPVVALAPAVPVPAPPRPVEPPSRWDQIRPLLEKAQVLAADGDVRGAQMLVVKAMELDPGEPQVWKTFKGIEQDLLVRAETFLADGQLPRALREFQFIISTNPESALGFNGVGQALLQLKNYDEAVAAFEKALVLEPGNARYRQALTRARSLQRASRALERQGQQNVKDMIEGQTGTKKGP